MEDDNGDQTFTGGERVSLTVKVTNSGKGDAKGVAVKLSGTSKALQYLGTSQTIGDIPAGESKDAAFGTVLPNRIDVDNGNIIIHVSEANGFDALEDRQLIVAMQPAKTTVKTDILSTIIDVDAPLATTGFERDNAYAVVVGITDYRPQ